MSWYDDQKELFYREQKQVEAKYPGLHFKVEEDKLHLTGKFNFQAIYEDELIEDFYEIDILFPDNYPKDVPVVWEIGDKIEKDYHCHSNGTLCLETYVETYKEFSKAPDILNFIEALLIPYLYRYSYIKKFGKAPFSECEHGVAGIIQWHQEYFELTDNLKILNLLLIVIENKYRGHLRCPCGSNKRLRNCHGPKLMNLMDVPKQYLMLEAQGILQQLKSFSNQSTA